MQGLVELAKDNVRGATEREAARTQQGEEGALAGRGNGTAATSDRSRGLEYLCSAVGVVHTHEQSE